MVSASVLEKSVCSSGGFSCAPEHQDFVRLKEQREFEELFVDADGMES